MARKIFGIGLNKTGTTSLKLAFQKLGYAHLNRTPRLFKLYQKGQFGAIFDWIADYETFEDWPWPLMVPELLAHYDRDALFVLTSRASGQHWVESLKRHAERTHPTRNPRRAIFGHDYPHGREAEHIAYYEAHLAATRSLFADRPAQLLDVCWDTGDGWPELCGFLGVKVPKLPFPHANQSKKASPDPENLMENQRRIAIQCEKIAK